MKKTIIAVAFSALFSFVAIVTLSRVSPTLWEHAFSLIGNPTQLATELEDICADHLAGRTSLRRVNLLLRSLTGQREFGGLFLTSDGLIPAFVPSEDTGIHQRNTRSLQSFAEDSSTPVAVVLLPTAAAILQDKLPPYAAEIQFNQHSFIESVNKTLSRSIGTVDTYRSLFSQRQDYLYYRTDGELTTHGGYIVYHNIANRLGLSPQSEQTFRIQYLPDLYYGELYKDWQHGGIKGDTIALYRSSTAPLFTVHHWRRYEEKTYHSLYPLEATVEGSPLDALLGGRSPIITITNHRLSASHGELLVLGDSNMMSVLPFLSLHYRTITFADPDMLTDSELASLDPGLYTQILFGFSLERYMNSAQPARAATAGSESPG